MVPAHRNCFKGPFCLVNLKILAWKVLQAKWHCSALQQATNVSVKCCHNLWVMAKQRSFLKILSKCLLSQLKQGSGSLVDTLPWVFVFTRCAEYSQNVVNRRTWDCPRIWSKSKNAGPTQGQAIDHDQHSSYTSYTTSCYFSHEKRLTRYITHTCTRTLIFQKYCDVLHAHEL